MSEGEEYKASVAHLRSVCEDTASDVERHIERLGVLIEADSLDPETQMQFIRFAWQDVVEAKARSKMLRSSAIDRKERALAALKERKKK